MARKREEKASKPGGPAAGEDSAQGAEAGHAPGGGHKSGGHGGGGHGEEVNLERWLVSYADFMTLMFCVFVMLYAMSKVEQQKVQAVGKAIRDAFGMQLSVQEYDGVLRLDRGDINQGSTDIFAGKNTGLLDGSSGLHQQSREGDDVLYDKIQRKKKSKWIENPDDRLYDMKESFSEVLMKYKASAPPESARLYERIALRVVPGMGVKVTLPEEVTFTKSDASLQNEVVPALVAIGNVLSPLTNRILIEGHTDPGKPTNPKFPSNWELSSARASIVARFLVDEMKISPERIIVAGYGEFHPVVSNDTAENRAKNRRVEITILKEELPRQNAPTPSPAAKN